MNSMLSQSERMKSSVVSINLVDIMPAHRPHRLSCKFFLVYYAEVALKAVQRLK